MQYVLSEYLVRDILQAIQGVWRICEDDVELFMADGQEVEDIAVDGGDVVQAQTSGFFAYELRVVPVHLYAVYA